MNVTAKR